MNEHNVIEIKDLSVDFMTVRGIVYAVQGVDLSVKEGEIHGVFRAFEAVPQAEGDQSG